MAVTFVLWGSLYVPGILASNIGLHSAVHSVGWKSLRPTVGRNTVLENVPESQSEEETEMEESELREQKCTA